MINLQNTPATNCNDAFYFSGGVPDPEIMTVNRYSHSLQGCIKEIFIQSQGPLNLGLEAIGGLNVEPCNSLNFK